MRAVKMRLIFVVAPDAVVDCNYLSFFREDFSG